MEIESQSNELENKKYLGIPFDALMFVRVIGGLDDCNVDEKGHLSLRLPENKTSIGMRNTTHGTLNAIVSDHIMGKFSESKFAVVSPLLDMAKNNELISLSPSDTYFWNVNKGVSIPNAILFAPEDHKLPSELGDELNVIRYKPNSDSQQNYANMTSAIGTYFKENDLPLYAVDNRSWRGRSLNEPTMDGSGRETKKIADHIGYPITWGLHDGTAYSELENIHVNISRTMKEFSSIDSAQAYYEANQKRMYSEQLPTFGEVHDRSLSQYQSLIGELPEHHKDYYDHNVLPEINNFKTLLDQKIDIWYPLEATLETSEQSFTQPPPLPLSSVNKNQELLDALINYRDSSDPGMQQLSMAHQDQKNLLRQDIDRLGINPIILPIGTTTNLYAHFKQLNGTNQKLFGSYLEQMTRDEQAQKHLDSYVKISQEMVSSKMAGINSVAEDIILLAPKRDFSENPELLPEWRNLKNQMFIKMQGDFNNIKDLNETSKMMDLCIEHIKNAPPKKWLQNLTNRNGSLHDIQLSSIETSSQLMDYTFNSTGKALIDTINAPPEAIIRMNTMKPLASSAVKIKTNISNQIAEGDLVKSKHNNESELTKPEQDIKNDVLKISDTTNSYESQSVVNKYLSNYMNSIPNKHNELLLKEKLLVERAKNKSAESVNQFIHILKENGLSDNDLIFSKNSDNESPEASYHAKIILAKSPEARMALSHAANALENYGSLCAVHQERFSEGFNRSRLNENPDSSLTESNLKEYSDLTKNIDSHFKQLEKPLSQYAQLFQDFDKNHNNQNILSRVSDLNKEINSHFKNNSFRNNNEVKITLENKNELSL